jgi:hypothetical protein
MTKNVAKGLFYMKSIFYTAFVSGKRELLTKKARFSPDLLIVYYTISFAVRHLQVCWQYGML